MRSIDEIADELLDAQEKWRVKMREIDKLATAAHDEYVRALIRIEDEVGIGCDVAGDAELIWGRMKFEWVDGGDLSVQFRELMARKGE
jgi:hypothetical protein